MNNDRSLRGLQQSVAIPTTGNLAHTHLLYTEGDELFDGMLADIGRAQHAVRLESYIFAEDEIGWQFAEALAKRAGAGIQVRVHLDALGSGFGLSRRLRRYFKQNKVTLRWFHRWSWRSPQQYNRRNHRKILIVDDDILFLGGYNIHRESSRRVVGLARWHDLHMRITGSLAAQCAELFDTFWNGHTRAGRIMKADSDRLVPNNTRRCRVTFHCLYTAALQKARRWIFLTTPYFVPDHKTQRLLCAAARLGVDVRLLVPAKSDHRLTQWAARSAYASLLVSGVRIYEYQPRILHGKATIVDDHWATIGSANTDYRSFFINHEINLVSHDPGLCRDLETRFRGDLTESLEILPHRWRHRPWPQHLTESIGWFARRWL